jgi:hypothetical protein
MRSENAVPPNQRHAQETGMSDAQFREIYQQLADGERNSESDAALLARLAALARPALSEAGSATLIPNALRDCLDAISQSPDLCPAALSGWLATDEDVPLGKVLQHNASIECLNQAYPQSFTLTGTNADQAALTAGRLCALAASPALSLGWALSLARDFPHSAHAVEAVAAVLDYHCAQLPSSTRRLLSAEASEFSGLAASISALAKLEEQDAGLDALPHLIELEMTADMRLLLSSMRRQERRDIDRQAHEQSFFMSFFKQYNLKYGGDTAIEIRGDAGTIDTSMEMSSFELSIELPLSETVDPVLGRMSRNRLWKGGRP